MVHKLYIEKQLKIKDFLEDKAFDVLNMYQRMYSGELCKVFVYSVPEKRIVELLTDYTVDVLGASDNKIRSMFLVDMDYKTMSSSMIETKTYVFSPNSSLSYQQTLFKLQDIANTAVERGKIPVVTVFDMRDGKKPLTITANIFGVKGPYNCYVPIFSCSRGAGGDGAIDSTVANLANDDAEQGVRRLVGTLDEETQVFTLFKNGKGLFQLPDCVNLNTNRSTRVSVTIAQRKARKARFLSNIYSIATGMGSKVITQDYKTNKVFSIEYNSSIQMKAGNALSVCVQTDGKVGNVNDYSIAVSCSKLATVNQRTVTSSNTLDYKVIVSDTHRKVVTPISTTKKFSILTGEVIDTQGVITGTPIGFVLPVKYTIGGLKPKKVTTPTGTTSKLELVYKYIVSDSHKKTTTPLQVTYSNIHNYTYGIVVTSNSTKIATPIVNNRIYSITNAIIMHSNHKMVVS